MQFPIGHRYCDWCHGYLSKQDFGKVSFAAQDYHGHCWLKQQEHLAALQKIVAARMSFRESERTVSTSGLLGS